MIPKEVDRLSLVQNLLSLSKPLQETVAQLAALDWDFEGEGVALTRKHFVSALQRYLRGELSEADIEFWANQIEGREDVEFEIDHEQEIKDVLYQLANPVLTQSLNHARAEVLFAELSNARKEPSVGRQ